MFTGIVETIGLVKAVRGGSGGKVISLELGEAAEGVKNGDSIAVNGVCLTVSRSGPGSLAEFDLSSETLKVSTLDRIMAGARVNIERALAANGRFGGHFVLGHVDAVADVKAIERKGDFVWMTFSAAAELLDEIVVKGSVCVDGVSLTVARMDKTDFSISLIPTTLKETTLGQLKVGDVVNIETDIITKTVKKQLVGMLPAKEKLTAERLKELGF
ncbi:MAG: riboflavin synthase [Planctomycetota bacterium]|jgi:riboflavin synthase